MNRLEGPHIPAWLGFRWLQRGAYTLCLADAILNKIRGTRPHSIINGPGYDSRKSVIRLMATRGEPA